VTITSGWGSGGCTTGPAQHGRALAVVDPAEAQQVGPLTDARRLPERAGVHGVHGVDADPDDELRPGGDRREEALDQPALGVGVEGQPGRGAEDIGEHGQPDRCLVVGGRVQHQAPRADPGGERHRRPVQVGCGDDQVGVVGQRPLDGGRAHRALPLQPPLLVGRGLVGRVAQDGPAAVVEVRVTARRAAVAVHGDAGLDGAAGGQHVRPRDRVDRARRVHADIDAVGGEVLGQLPARLLGAAHHGRPVPHGDEGDLHRLGRRVIGAAR